MDDAVANSVDGSAVVELRAEGGLVHLSRPRGKAGRMFDTVELVE